MLTVRVPVEVVEVVVERGIFNLEFIVGDQVDKSISNNRKGLNYNRDENAFKLVIIIYSKDLPNFQHVS